MAVTVTPELESVLGDQVTLTLLIGSGAPAGKLATAVTAAANDIAATGLLLTTGESVVAGQVFRADGTRWCPTDQEWAAERELWDFANPSYVQGPVPVPGGQLLMIDYHYTPPELCRQTLRLLAGRLDAAGILAAQISLAPQLSDDRFQALHSLSPVALAFMRADAEPYTVGRFAEMPSAARFTDLAMGWLRSQHTPGMQVLALVGGSTEVPLTLDNLRPAVEQVLTAELSTDVVLTDFASRAVTARLGSFGQTGISLAAAARGWDPRQVTGQMRALRDMIRLTAPQLGWAGVATQASTGSTGSVPLSSLPRDEFDLSPMWYQLLSPAQLQRTGGPPPQAAEVAAGRFELTIGEPQQWIPGHPDYDKISAYARSVLPGRAFRK